MISIEECKKILNAGDRKYTDDEVEKIRDFLYRLAQIAIEAEQYQKEQKNENPLSQQVGDYDGL